MTTTSEAAVQRPTPLVDRHRLLTLETPFGHPVTWADVGLVTDPGDSHELNDDRCLVLTSHDLGDASSAGATDFMLCLLADGATGSTFQQVSRSSSRFDVSGAAPAVPAGWRASQLAQAVFVERFLSSAEVDILDRLKDGLRAADRALSKSDEGVLSTTLVALYLSSDGTAYAASIGDSVLLVLPPRRKTPDERKLQKLGYEDSTSVGSGDTTLSGVDQDQLIEQWWPNKDSADTTRTRLEPGTYLVLMSDGVSDNLPAEVIDRLLKRHAVDRATVGLPIETRERRARTQKHDGGSTQQLGLDNMSAIVVRFDGSRGARRLGSSPPPQDACLVSVLGTHGGPTQGAGGQFGLICLAGREHGTSVAPSFVRHFIESEHRGEVLDRLGTSLMKAQPRGGQARFAALALDHDGVSHTFCSGGARVGSSR